MGLYKVNEVLKKRHNSYKEPANHIIMAKIIAFTKKNTRFPSLPEEDSFQYLKTNNKVIVAVADGITRDPIGVKDYPSVNNKKATKAALDKYPNPSPARYAADEFCNSFTKFLKKDNKTHETSLLNAFKFANGKINNLNREYNPSIDYLENDYWACVASGGVIINNFLYWGYICDCGVCVFDKLGNLRFRTADDMKDVSKYIDSQGKSFRSASWRKIIRYKYRNNLKNVVAGKLMSYGALTGEHNALEFVKIGKFKLEKGDYVCFYSDGMAEVIYSKEFKSNLIKKKLDDLKEFSERVAKKDKKYEKEGTLVLVSL